MISNLAYIHPKAKIAENVTIEPFASVYADVEIGSGTWIGPNAVIMDGSRIGQNNKIFPGAVVGAVPQDLKYKGEPSLAEIGNNCVIRECVTINRGTEDRMTTKMGDNCLIMAYVHLAHDCILGNGIILANSVGLSGHINIEDFAIIEGMAGAQQFITIGKHTFVGGASQIRKSIPPYIRAAREPVQYIGVNSVGLSRRGFSKETIRHIEDIYRIIFVRGLGMTRALEAVESEIEDTPYRREIVDFIRAQKDGIIKGI